MALAAPVTTLLFDMFGTTVDWRSSITVELEQFGRTHGVSASWSDLTDRWRAGFRDLQGKIARGERAWITMDQIHREVLEGLLQDLDTTGLANSAVSELNRAWHRLNPWPDTVEGLTQLKQDRVIGTLSNGNLSLLINVTKHGGLPWDCVLSSGMFGTYKPNLEVYLGAVKMLDVEPSEVMMVAAHAYDVDGAHAAGLKTAYVFRPDEFGPGKGEDPGDTSRFDVTVSSFVELADRLRR